MHIDLGPYERKSPKNEKNQMLSSVLDDNYKVPLYAYSCVWTRVFLVFCMKVHTWRSFALGPVHL